MVENLGSYRAYVEIQGHEFYAEADRRGGIRIYREVIPEGCSSVEDGHSPYYRRAKSVLGRHFAERKRRRPEPTPRLKLL